MSAQESDMFFGFRTRATPSYDFHPILFTLRSVLFVFVFDSITSCVDVSHLDLDVVELIGWPYVESFAVVHVPYRWTCIWENQSVVPFAIVFVGCQSSAAVAKSNITNASTNIGCVRSRPRRRACVSLTD